MITDHHRSTSISCYPQPTILPAMNEQADLVPVERGGGDQTVTEIQHQSTEGSSPRQAAKLNNISFILTLAALALFVFCVALDNVIIVTAIPRITDDFHSVNDIGW